MSNVTLRLSGVVDSDRKSKRDDAEAEEKYHTDEQRREVRCHIEHSCGNTKRECVRKHLFTP